MQIRIDTSKMDDLIAAAGDPVKFIVADGVEYGVYQEFTASGHPSLVPAFERVTKPIKRALMQAIEKGIDLGGIVRKAAFDIQDLWASDVNVDTGAYKGSIHVED